MRYGDMLVCVLRGDMNVFVISTRHICLMLDKRKTRACLCHISANLAYMYSTEPHCTITYHSKPLFDILMNYD